MNFKKLLTIVCASFVLGLSSCSPPVEAPQPTLFTSGDVAQIADVISKPTSLAKFSPDSPVGELRPYRPQYENSSDECNAVLDLSYAASSAMRGSSGFKTEVHPTLRNVSSVAGVGYVVTNERYDIRTEEGLAQWKTDYAAGLDTSVESSSVRVAWLLFPSSSDAESLLENLHSWVEPCGTIRQEGALGDEANPTAYVLSDSLLAMQKFENGEGFVMEREVSTEMSDKDGRRLSERGVYIATFVLRQSNVIAIVNYGLSENAVGALGLGDETGWDGALDLLDQTQAHFAPR